MERKEHEKQDLLALNEDLHQKRDFTMKNFEIRQTARNEEFEALKQAKSILSGAKLFQGAEGAQRVLCQGEGALRGQARDL